MSRTYIAKFLGGPMEGETLIVGNVHVIEIPRHVPPVRVEGRITEMRALPVYRYERVDRTEKTALYVFRG